MNRKVDYLTVLDGIITKGIGGFYYVLCEGKIYECKARGVFRKEKITPLAGDYVKIQVKDGKGSILEILPRRNCLVRPAVANVDTLALVVSAAYPEPDMTLVDKMLIHAEISGTEAVLCINKTDIGERQAMAEIYKNAGYRVISVSAEKKENLEELYELINGKVTAFAGVSGVGKSSLLNVLTGAGMETGALSDKIQRGKNTTRHVELIPVSGGFVLDTPGFSSFELSGIEFSDLWKYFPEFHSKISDCKFRDCSHTREQKNCAVKDAVQNGEISESRYNSYCELYNILKEKKSF